MTDEKKVRQAALSHASATAEECSVDATSSLEGGRKVAGDAVAFRIDTNAGAFGFPPLWRYHDYSAESFTDYLVRGFKPQLLFHVPEADQAIAAKRGDQS